jgi:predicted RNA binding protein YcfA (HicA-like mRNA interferase family)
MNPKEIIRRLKAAGFEEVSQRGSHLKLKHADGRITVVPVHGRDLGIGLVKAIERQSGVTLKI